MNKTGLAFLILFSVIACNEPKSSTSEPVTEPVIAEETTTQPEVTELPLIAKYDCAICHRAEEKLQGPSYQEIANKYSAQSDAVKYLSSKMINGSTGVWGNIPMNAHPGMPKEDAEAISKYILSLKK